MKIVIENNTIQYHSSLTYSAAMSLLCSAMLDVLRRTAEAYPDQKHILYDEFNMAASQVLKEFIPDRELRPDLTERAILEMENRLLDEIQ